MIINRRVWPLVLTVSLIACRGSEMQLFHGSSSPLTPDPAPQVSDLTADQLIAKSAAARGGENKLQGIHSVVMTGKWETNRISSSPVTLMIAPGRYLRRIELQEGGALLKVVDGQTTWEVTPQLRISKPTPMVSQEAARYRRLADPQGPLVNYLVKGNKVEVVGKMPWQNSMVYKLKVTFRDGGVNYIYLDAQSFLPVRFVHTMYVPQLDKSVDIEFVSEDFRDVNGVKWPFKEKSNAPEVNFKQSITWEKIDTNKPLDEAAFKAPKS